MRNRQWLSYVGALLVLATIGGPAARSQQQFKMPQPGDIYREYSLVLNSNGNDWRVTDPNTSYPDAQQFLPNPTLYINIDDLQDAVRAELLIVEWGGHIGTNGKMVRFNGNNWIPIPNLDTTNGIPVGHEGQCYQHEVNVGLDIPLNNLVQGTNSFEGTSGDQTCYGFNWGQWGWYGVIVRVYYSGSKSHPTGQITSPVSGGSFNDSPLITTSTSANVDRVDFLAYYDGYDTDGDGKYAEYHHDYHRLRNDTQLIIRNHVGTVNSAPFQITWNTDWVADQPAGGIKLLARIHRNDGMWYVTPEVTNLSLLRNGKSVRFYKPMNVPEDYWMQHFAGQTKSSNFDIPGGTNVGDGVSAKLYVRTWNGNNEFGQEHYTHVNSWSAPTYGEGHYFSYDVLDMPASAVVVGSNTIEFFANSTNSDGSEQHGIEVMWPGPAVSVTYSGNYASPVPGGVTLSSPANDATGQDIMTPLSWNPGLAASSYQVQVATDAGFSSVVFDTTVSGTSVTTHPLANLQKHYWRVRAHNAAGDGPFSSTWNFTTFTATPAAAVLASPPNNATNQSTQTITFQWHPLDITDFYRFQLSSDSTFGGGFLKNDSSLVDTFRVVSLLAENTQYYWRVNGRNSGGNGPFSPVWTFRTFAPIPSQVTIISPQNQALISADSVTCVWNTTQPEAAQYWHEIAFDSLFVFKMVDSTITDTTTVVRQLQNNQTYYWRVRAGSAGGWGQYSDTRSFTISITDVKNHPGIPSDFSLSQNYPNPFNPSTRIEFAVPRESAVTLEVFDVLGEKIATLVQDTRPAGYYTVQWNAGRVGSGIYMYRLTAGTVSIIRKMLVVK